MIAERLLLSVVDLPSLLKTAILPSCDSLCLGERWYPEGQWACGEDRGGTTQPRDGVLGRVPHTQHTPLRQALHQVKVNTFTYKQFKNLKGNQWNVVLYVDCRYLTCTYLHLQCAFIYNKHLTHMYHIDTNFSFYLFSVQ